MARGVELGTAYVSLTVDGSGIGRSINREISRAAPSVEKSSHHIGRSIARGVGKTLKAGAIVVGAAAGLAGVAAGKALMSGFQSAVSQQNAKKVLSGLYGSAKQATQMMKDLRKVASGSSLNYDAYTKAAQSLAYAGVKGKDAVKTLKNVGKAISAAGGNDENLNRATDAILKMVNAGKVQLDTLQQLSDAGVPILSGLAKHFGVSIAQVNKMASKGKIKLSDVMSVMKNGTGKTFQQMIKAGDKADKSFGNVWKRIKDNVTTSIGAAMVPALKKLAPVLERAGAAFQKLLNKQLKKLPGFIDSATTKWKSFMAGLTGPTKKVKKFEKTSHSLASALANGTDSAKKNKKSVGALATALGNGASKSKKFRDDMSKNDTKMQGLGATIRKLVKSFKSGGISGVLGSLKDSIKGAFKGMDWASLNKAFSSIWDSLKRLAPLAGQFFQTLPAVSPTVTVLSKVMGFLADHVKLLGKALPVLIGAFVAYKVAQMANNVVGRQSLVGFGLQLVAQRALIRSNRQLAASIGSGTIAITGNTVSTEANTAATSTGVMTRIRSTASMVAQRVATIAAAAATRAYAVAQRLVNVAMRANPIGLVITALIALGAAFVVLWKKSETFRKIVKGAWAGIKAAALAVWHWFDNKLVPGFKAIWKILTGGFTGFTGKIKAGWGKILGAFKAAWKWISGIFKNHWKTILAILGGPIGLTVKYVIEHWDKIKKKFWAAWTWVRGKFSSAWNGVKKVITDPIGAVKGFLEKQVEGWKAVFRGAKKAIGKIWDGITRVIKMPINGVISAINAFTGGINNIANKIPGVSLHIPKIPKLADGGVAGQKVRGPWRGAKADNVLGVSSAGVPVARVNPGEYVTSVAATNRMERNHPGAMDYINRTGRLPGFGIGGIIGKIGGGIKDVVGGVVGKIKDIGSIFLHPIKWLKDHLLKPFLGKLGNSLPATMIKGFAKWAIDKIGGLFSFGGGGNYKVGAGVKQWTGVAKRAMKAAGLPMGYLPLLLYRMGVESGGNPNAINLWDVNAKNGVPSQGLMQVIPPTFAAYAGPYRKLGIRNPFANIYAAIKYSLARYGIGGLRSAWGGHGGYAGGTNFATRGWHMIGENGPEWMYMRGGEKIRPHGSSVDGSVDLSDRTLSRLADAVASQVIEMDGHTVARIIAGHTGQDRASQRIASAGAVSA